LAAPFGFGRFAVCSIRATVREQLIGGPTSRKWLCASRTKPRSAPRFEDLLGYRAAGKCYHPPTCARQPPRGPTA